MQAELWLSSITTFGEDGPSSHATLGDNAGKKKSVKGTAQDSNKSCVVSQCE